MVIWENDIVEVNATSSHGKNRINNHGVIWKVIKVVKIDALGIIPNGSVLVSSMMNGKDYMCWVKPNDKHFEIVRIVDLNNI